MTLSNDKIYSSQDALIMMDSAASFALEKVADQLVAITELNLAGIPEEDQEGPLLVADGVYVAVDYIRRVAERTKKLHS